VVLTLELCQHAFPVNGTEEIVIKTLKMQTFKDGF
jgi:hypothetical protein